jgi:hypothetical protein
MTTQEIAEWAKDHMKDNEEGLFADLLMIGSLNPKGFTLWEGSLYEG